MIGMIMQRLFLVCALVCTTSLPAMQSEAQSSTAGDSQQCCPLVSQMQPDVSSIIRAALHLKPMLDGNRVTFCPQGIQALKRAMLTVDSQQCSYVKPLIQRNMSDAQEMVLQHGRLMHGQSSIELDTVAIQRLNELLDGL